MNDFEHNRQLNYSLKHPRDKITGYAIFFGKSANNTDCVVM